MLLNALWEKKIYNPEDHLFIFLSLLYALTIHFTIENISHVVHSTYVLDNPFWPNSIMIFGWNISIIVLAAESWWGAWADKRQFSKDFKRFLILISYPILLSVASKSLSHLTVIKLESEFQHNAYVFFLLTTIILFIFLSYLRWYIDKNTDHIHFRIFFLLLCGLLAYVSFVNAPPTNISDPEATLKIIILSILFQICGLFALFSFVKIKRNNLFNKYKLEQFEFIDKILGMANLAYRHGTPFSFFVVKVKGLEDNTATYDYVLDTIVKGTRGYHLCSHLTDHIAIFIPYIDKQDNTSLQQVAEDLKITIENRIKNDPKTKDINIITGINISTFNQQKIDEIKTNSGNKKGSIHISNLNEELKRAYRSALHEVTGKESKELAEL